MKTLVLASGSPSRKEILEETGYPFIIDASNYEEDMGLDLSPKDLAMTLSKGKARDVAKRHKNAIVLAADSFGVFKDQLLGKPHTIERAKEMLTLLSGQRHSFMTSYTIIDSNSGREYTGIDETKVYFKKLTPQEIDDYLSKENVLEKAGAYTIQGRGKHFIDKIEGDYDNVRGLPLYKVTEALMDFDVNLKSEQ